MQKLSGGLILKKKKKRERIQRSQQKAINGVLKKHWQEVKIEAARRGLTNGELLSKALEEFLEKNCKPKNFRTPLNDKTKRIRVCVTMDVEFWRWVKGEALKKNIILRKLVNNAIDYYLIRTKGFLKKK
jgi:hypothetical protein